MPQGSILGPALFLLFDNDLHEAVKSSQIAMFADDTKLFKIITFADDVDSFQRDLSTSESRSLTSVLLFNKSKCGSQSITRKMQSIVTTYKMNGVVLETTESERDLGVWSSTKLTWNTQRHGHERY